ncbi:MAG TPA: DUF4157 domain-containing protein, partial [Symbiobacteriaceae bacterium]|nr:DUF4157 domain-containing protein [Symbiobacteriaceae bacterium]
TATQALGARAFAHGSEIWLGAGESANDVGLMAHETAHVVQQSGGSPAPAPAPAAPMAVQRTPTGTTTTPSTSTAPATGGGTGTAAAAPANSGTDIGNDTIEFDELEIPSFKAQAHRGALYNARLSAGTLRRNRTFQRDAASGTDTDHDNIWKDAVSPAAVPILTQKASRAVPPARASGNPRYRWTMPGGTTYNGTIANAAKRFAHPTWDVNGQPHANLYSVDHIVEIQVADWPADRSADGIDNFELLDRPINESSGRTVMQNVRARAAAWGAKQTPVQSAEDVKAAKHLKFKAIRGAGATATNRDFWRRNQIEEGVHLRWTQVSGVADENAIYVMTNQEGEGDGMSFTPDATPTDAERYWLRPFVLTNKSFVTAAGSETNPSFGSLTVEVPGLDKNFRAIPATPVPLRRYHDALTTGWLSQNDLPWSALHLRHFSPLRVDSMRTDPNQGLYVQGAILSSVPLLPGEIPFRIDGGDFQVYKEFSGGAIRLPPPLSITNSSLAVALGTYSGISLTGQVDFALGRVATGRLGARASTGTAAVGGESGPSFALTGELNFDTSIFDQARIGMTYENNELSANGDLTIGRGKLRGINSGSLHVEYQRGLFSMTGTVAPQIPGVQTASLSASYSEEQGFKIAGDATLSDGIPGIRSGQIHLELQQGEEGWKMAGTGTAVPAIPGIDSTLTIGYDNGLFLAEAHAGYNRGMLSGSIDVGVTNRPIDENGQPVDGDPTENLSVWGGGQLTLQIAPWLQGTAGVRFNPAGEIAISGAIGLPSALDVFPMKEIHKEIFRTPPLDIPIVGLSVAGARVGIFATLSGGLDASASIGPGQLQELGLQVDYSPDHEDQTHIHGGAKFHVPADAGLRLSIRGGLGAGIPLVSASANLEVGGRLGITGAADAAVDVDWTPQTGLVLDAEASVSAQPALTFDVTGFVLVEFGAFGLTTELYRHDWRLAQFSMGSDYRFGVHFPIHYQEGQPFDVSLDDIEFDVPEIDPMSTLSSLVDRITPATE